MHAVLFASYNSTGETVFADTPFMPDLDPTTTWTEPTTPLALAGKRLHFVGIGGCGTSGLARLVA